MYRLSSQTLILFFLLLLADPPRVSFLRPPAIVTDQYLVTYRVRVPIHEDNRLLALAAFDGDVRVNYSERDLGSEQRKTIWDVNWRLPPGEITLVAAVYGNAGQLGRVTHRILVLSAYGP